MDDVFVAQLMTREPQTVAPDTPVDDAADLMLDDTIGSVIVVENDRLRGILTRTDFVRLVADHEEGAQTQVSTYMTDDVITTAPQAPITDAADVMIAHGFHHLPVVDDDDRLVGVVTTTDLTGYLADLETPLA